MTNAPNNADRAEIARMSVDLFATQWYHGRTFEPTFTQQPNEGDDAYAMVQDLMTNLMHLAHSKGWDAKEMARRAQSIFEDEIAEEEEEGTL